MKKKNNFTDIYSYFNLKKNLNEKMMKRIFSLLRVDSTFMTTSYNRMHDVNVILNKYIKKNFSKKIVLCDFAISSGQSTLELFSDLDKIKIKEIYGFDKKINITVYKLGKFIFLYSSDNELLMIEYNKQCLRYRYFFLFKLVEKFLPRLFNQIYLFDLVNIKLKKSKMLIPSLNNIKELKFFEQDIFKIEKIF